MKTDDYFSITKAVKARIPKLPFRDMKVLILGKKYSLSLVFGSGRLLKKLNRIYRRQNRVTDILSFSLSPKEGEIFINPKQAGKESRWFGETKTNFISHLFIHGLLHLKGHRHGSKMESLELKYRKRFPV